VFFFLKVIIIRIVAMDVYGYILLDAKLPRLQSCRVMLNRNAKMPLKFVPTGSRRFVCHLPSMTVIMISFMMS